MPLKRVGEANGGQVSKLSATGLKKKEGGLLPMAVTAARNEGGNLEVVVWDLAQDGTPTVRAATTEGRISEVAVASTGDLRFVVAMRDGQGKLRLIAYDVPAGGGDLKRLDGGTRVGGKITKVVASSPSDDVVCTAAQLPDESVEVSFWKVNDDGTIAPPVVNKLGKATAIDIGGSTVPLLVARTQGGRLRMRAFKAQSEPSGTGTGSLISQLSTDHLGSSEGYFIGTISPPPVGVRTGPKGLPGRIFLDTGTFTISKWEFEDGTMQSPLKQVAEASLGEIDSIAFDIDVLDMGSPVVVTATSGVDTFKKLLPKDQGKPRLRLVAWDANGDQIEVIAKASMSGRHDLISLARVFDPAPSTSRSGRFVTATRDSKGKLKIAVWAISE